MNIFNPALCAFANFDHIPHVSEMICNLLVAILTRYLCFFDSIFKLAIFCIAEFLYVFVLLRGRGVLAMFV